MGMETSVNTDFILRHHMILLAEITKKMLQTKEQEIDILVSKIQELENDFLKDKKRTDRLIKKVYNLREDVKQLDKKYLYQTKRKFTSKNIWDGSK